MNTDAPIKYRKIHKYNYELTETYKASLSIHAKIKTPYITIYGKTLWIKKGYAWDGATLFPDVKSIMTAALMHDCLYQLIRAGKLNLPLRKEADIILRETCMRNGMNKVTAWCVFFGVRLFGCFAIKKSPTRRL